MKIELHPKFKKNFKKRIAGKANLVARFDERLELFINDPFNPILQNHKLLGKKFYIKSFSITGDIRLLYYFKDKDIVVFLDIGSHNQVY